MATPESQRPTAGSNGSTQVGTTIYQRLVDAAAAAMQSPHAMPGIELMAERAGVDVVQARQLFADDAALCAAVAEDAIVKLSDFVVHRIAGVPIDDPAAQMQAIMQAHIDWGVENLCAARMVLDPNVPSACRPIYQRYVTGMQDMWRLIIRRIDEAGKLHRAFDRDVAETLGRSMVIGMGRILVGDDDDFLRDRDPVEMHALMTKAISAYCQIMYVD